MRNVATVAARASAALPSRYDYALFNMHDGVIEGSSIQVAADSNPANEWELAAVNFNAAQWTDKSGWWTGTLASQYVLSANLSSYPSENARFAADDKFDGACYLIACMLNLPLYATAAQRIVCMGTNNNAERFQLRYTSGDILQFLAGDNDVVSGSIDITSHVNTDLVFVGIIDDRPDYETFYARVYQAGSRNLVNAVSESTDSITWLSSASARYLQVGSLPNVASGNPLTGSVRRLLLVPFGQNPPADLTEVCDELAMYNLTRFETL